MNRPWMKLHTRDWLDNKELRRCSPAARSILMDLMCLAHEGIPYGHLSDKIGPLAEDYTASRCHVRIGLFRKSVRELEVALRVKWEGQTLTIPRMIEDEKLRAKRAAGGHASIGHPNTHPPKEGKGYPYHHPSLEDEGGGNSHARTAGRSDSGSVSDSSQDGKGDARGKPWIDEAFDAFWGCVWARIGKDAARKAYKRKAATKADAERINTAARAQGPRIVADANEQGRSVLHPATWLNQGRYDDEGLVLRPSEHDEFAPELMHHPDSESD